jgi:CO dehydrogenase/acetyl-CoA synthase alpha subunit
VKDINASVTATFRKSAIGEDQEWRLEIKDKDSRQRIAEVRLTREAFFDMMSSLGETSAEVRLFDSYDNAGKIKEQRAVLIEDERLKGSRSNGFEAVIDFHRRTYEVDGWKLVCPNPCHLSQGQHDARNGTLRTIRYRFVEKGEEE